MTEIPRNSTNEEFLYELSKRMYKYPELFSNVESERVLDIGIAYEEMESDLDEANQSVTELTTEIDEVKEEATETVKQFREELSNNQLTSSLEISELTIEVKAAKKELSECRIANYEEW